MLLAEIVAAWKSVSIAMHDIKRYKKSTLTVPDVDAVCNEDTVDSAELRAAAKRHLTPNKLKSPNHNE